MSPSSTGDDSTLSIKTHLRTDEGVFNLAAKKCQQLVSLHYSQHKTPTKVTVAHLNEVYEEDPQSSNASSSGRPSIQGKNVSRNVPTSTGNGKTTSILGSGSIFSMKFFAGRSQPQSVSCSPTQSQNFFGGTTGADSDGEGTYLIFNLAEYLFVADFNTLDKDPIKMIHMPGYHSISHSFSSESQEGEHDFILGTDTGDLFSCSLRAQLLDTSKKIVSFSHYNKEGINSESRVTKVAWVPGGSGQFVSAHANGSLLVYDTTRDCSAEPALGMPGLGSGRGSVDSFSVVKSKGSKLSLMARWQVSSSAINDMAFSPDGQFLATVGRDGYLRVFDWYREELLGGGRSYYGAGLCCAFSQDGALLLAGGEDDLIQIWSVPQCKLIAWGEGHGSWVSSVSFAPPPGRSDPTVFGKPADSVDLRSSIESSAGSDFNSSSMYRFASVAQDTQLLLWDLSLEEILLSSSLKPKAGTSLWSHSAERPGPSEAAGVKEGSGQLSACLLQPSPSPWHQDLPRISPSFGHKVHADPLTDVVFWTESSLVTACAAGHVDIWRLQRKADKEGEWAVDASD